MTSVSPEAFDEIDPGSGNRTACTPEIDGDFTGLRINAPALVRFTPGNREPFTDAFARIMLCGVYRLSSAFVYRVGGVLHSVTVVATDVESHETHTAKLVPDHPFEPSPQSYSEEELKDMERQFETGYFNENLAQYLQLPERTARYNVFVVLGPYKSNVVSITVRSTVDEGP